MITHCIGVHVVLERQRARSKRAAGRAVRRAGLAAAAAGSLLTLAAFAPHATREVPGLVPGLSFRVSSTVRIYPGDTPRAQDDEVMRGRGIAANNRSRIEFLAFTPLPQNLTTDDYLIGLDSGKV